MANSLPEAVREYFNDMQKNIHTCIPGTIQSFDAASCTAKVQPAGKFKKPNGEFLDYPEVTEVPICLIQSSGQDVTIAYPIKEGDGCLIFFSEQQLDGWRDEQTPDTELRFDLTSGIAIVGLFSSANDIIQEACDNDAVIIKNKDNAKVTIKEDSIESKIKETTFLIEDNKVTVTSSNIKLNGNVEVNGKVTASDDVVAYNKTSLGLHVHSGVTTGPGTSGPPLV